MEQGALVAVTNTSQCAKICGEVRLSPGQTASVPMAFVASFGPDRDLRFDFSAAADYLRSWTDDGRLYFDLWVPMSVVDGYGAHALALYRGLRDLGVEANLRRTEKFHVDPIYLDPELIVQTQVNRSKLPSRVAVSFTLGYDETIWNNSSLIKIALTQFETTRMPKTQVSYINKCDHLIVTSSFQTEVVKNSGVKIPVSVMTPGVDTDFFTVRPERGDGEFRVLILGALTGRKNPIGAIQVFQQASQNDPNWRLTIKTRNADGIDLVRRIAKADSRIKVIVEDSHPNSVLDYYHSHDCLLWPSKGEGVGLPPLEALSCGLEVVCSANSGMLDFVSDGWAWPIRTERMEPAGWPENLNGFSEDYVTAYGEVGEWWLPDLNHAVRQLRAAHNAWANGKGKGRKAAAEVRRNHTLRHQAESVLRVVEEWL